MVSLGIVHYRYDRGKSMVIKIVRSSNFPNADHVMFSTEIFSCLFRIYFDIHMHEHKIKF